MVKPQVAKDGTRTALLTDRDSALLARAAEVLTQFKIADGSEWGDVAQDLAVNLSGFLGDITLDKE